MSVLVLVKKSDSTNESFYDKLGPYSTMADLMHFCGGEVPADETYTSKDFNPLIERINCFSSSFKEKIEQIFILRARDTSFTLTPLSSSHTVKYRLDESGPQTEKLAKES